MNYKRIHDRIVENASSREKVEDVNYHMHHIIPRHEDPLSEETVPLTLKEHYIIHLLRYKITGTKGNLLAYKALKGVYSAEELVYYKCSIGGSKGGRITKDTSVGIFDPNYDRSFYSKKNFEEGKMDKFLDAGRSGRAGRAGGSNTRKNKSGIFREDLQYLRSEWAMIGAMALKESGNYGGFTSKGWREENPDKLKENASKGGKVGGKWHKGKTWWNNGLINRRCENSPGEGWVKGLLRKNKVTIGENE